MTYALDVDDLPPGYFDEEPPDDAEPVVACDACGAVAVCVERPDGTLACRTCAG